jgi:hypothetical protein
MDLQASFFKITLMSNSQWAMDQPMDLNPISRLWKKFTSNVLLCACLFEFIKVVDLNVVQIIITNLPPTRLSAFTTF